MACSGWLALAVWGGSLAGCAAPGARATAPAAPSVLALLQSPVRPADAAIATATATDAAGLPFDDAVLPLLLAAARAASPQHSAAQARVARVKAELAAGIAAWRPQAQARVAAARGRSETDATLGHSVGAGLQLGWEIDLFGAGAAATQAQQAKLQGAQAAGQAALLALDAEVAQTYAQLRVCEQQQVLAAELARSHQADLNAARQALQAGLVAPAAVAQLEAAAWRQRQQQEADQLQCRQLVKALGVLTALNDTQLQALLSRATVNLPRRAAMPGPQMALPARLLDHRPDLAEALQAVEEAAAQHRGAAAQKWPRLSFQGLFGTGRVSHAEGLYNGRVWSFGPIQVVMPLLQSEVHAAHMGAALAAYQDAVLQLEARVRVALREVEQAQMQLGSVDQRRADLAKASVTAQAAWRTAQQHHAAGLINRLQLEEARRQPLALAAADLDLQQAWFSAAVALHTALGGRWIPADGARLASAR